MMAFLPLVLESLFRQTLKVYRLYPIRGFSVSLLFTDNNFFNRNNNGTEF